jgi:tetratricopeptide (TPR) repeat protein
MQARLYQRYAVLLLLGFLCQSPVNAADSRFCDSEFDQIAFTNNQYPTLESKLEALRHLKKQCGGTGIYEFRLANLELRAGHLERAEQTLREGLRLDTIYEKELRSGLADIDIKRGNLAAAEKAYVRLAKDYPGWYLPAQNLGLIKIDQEQFDDAIRYLLTANRIEPTAFTDQNLAIAYNVTGQHEKAVEAMNQAFSLSKDAANDVDAMLATALSYGWLNKFDVADGILRMLMDSHPGIQESVKFQRALRFLRKRNQAARTR